MVQLLDQQGVEKAHLVGFSMGGGVALELARMAPDRVASISLVASIGVQELELLGDYRLNHFVHGVQLAGLWLLREAVPHMGAWDDSFLGVEYARNFFDSDQRPLRQILSHYDGPLLIVHGKKDPLVPAAAAIEHARLAPQGEFDLTERSHFFIFNQGPALAQQLSEFFQRVDRGQAKTRQDVSPQLQALAREPYDPTTAPPFEGFTLTLVLLSLVAATFISEDFTCIGAGLLVAAGRLAFLPGVAACLVGIFVGDLGLYAAGRFLGRPALRRRPFSWLLREEDVERSSQWFDKRGPAIILATRFLPGTRLPTYFAAGLFGTRFWTFSFFFLLAAAVWTPALVGLAAWLGLGAQDVLASFERYAWVAVLGLALLILVGTKILLPALTHKGRRLLRGSLGRWTRWEYWPPWLFYPPVVMWILWLGLRHRSPTLFTAANPGIPASGFIGESKNQILEALRAPGQAVARYALLSPGSPDERLRRAHDFLAEEELSFPVVLKPDAGQRGADVLILRELEDLEARIVADLRPLILQEYVPGQEFGVFYLRLPDDEKGQVFSITEKHLPEVLGDGEHTVEELILADNRLLPMARHYLRVQADSLQETPQPGARHRLVELGTHSRGAVFVDGGWISTPELERAFEEISSGFEGFFFGRYDIRTESIEELRQGRGFKVLELNGVTSEATHIYDPKNSLLEAYRVLFRQWSLAFEIGRQNVARGAKTTSALALAREVLAFRRISKSAANL